MKRFLLLVGAALVFTQFAPFAQVPEPAPVVFGAGGTRASDGTLVMIGTAGQSAVGTVLQGSNVHHAGFWQVLDVLHIGPSTAVAIAAFDVRATSKGVELSWIVATADGLAGFNIYRAEGEEGDYVRVNTGALVPPGETSYRDTEVEPGRTYWYQIGAIDHDGEFYSMRRSVSTPHRTVELQQNYPNPFNPATRIDYYVPRNVYVTMSVYDVAGRHIRTLVDNPVQTGHHSVVWNGVDARGESVSSGVYFYRMIAGDKAITRKLVVVK
jgi:hypothetical protein